VYPESLGWDDVLAVNEMPMIGIIRSVDGERVAGRFFPSIIEPRSGKRISVIMVFEHNDPAVTLATIAHETCHWLSYCAECKHVPHTKRAVTQCRYRGEHDAEFYERLTAFHRTLGTPTYAARAVEGDYPYPESWNADEWPA